MTYLKWEEELNTGIEQIDLQHRQIVDYINQLYDVHHNKIGGQLEVKETILNLIDYTLLHFSLEESLFEKSGYGNTEEHCKNHIKFSKIILDYKHKLSKGEDITESLLNLLYDWLFVHILHEDADYVPTIKNYLATRSS